jgi:hypothetical protein
MTVTKTAKGWLSDSRPNGEHGKRYRKTFETKGEAREYEAWLKNNVTQASDWQPQKRDSRRLLDLIDIWGVVA